MCLIQARMRILVLNFEYPPLGGGASPVSHEISKRYVQLGHHVSVITMHFKGLPERETLDGVDVIRIKCMRKHIHMCQPYEQYSYVQNAWFFLKNFLPQHHFDFCHAHFILPTGILARRIRNRFKIPYIITAHGSDVPHFNPDRFRFLHVFTPPLIRKIARTASHLTSPSQYLAGLIHRVLPADQHTIEIIPNGIDTSAFRAGRKQPFVVSSGRLLPRKGFHDLLHAVRHEALPIEVHILGDGPMRQELEQLAASSATPVFFHGWMDNRSETYVQLLASATIYCLVSLRENASISILEAMASGCAVITSDASGCPEMVGDAGILVRHGHPEEIREAILRLIEDNDLRTQLSLTGIGRVRHTYDWDRITGQYLNLMQKNTQPQPA